MRTYLLKTCSAALISACVALPFSTAVANVSSSTALQNLDFNYDITGEGAPNWKPIEVFSTGGKTYIKYANVSGEHDLPDLYLKSDGHRVPKWKWESPYVVVDSTISSAQVVSPHTGKILYQIDEKASAVPYIAPAPKLRAKRMAGFFVELNGGVGGVDNQKFKNPVVNASIGYDAALSDHWLLGVGVGGTYNGKSNKIGFSPNTYKIQSYDIEVTGRATYLFYSGFTIFGKAGLAYVINKAVNVTFSPKPEQTKKIAPKMAIGVGYQTNIGLGFNLQFSRLFDTNSTANANALTIGIGYHF